MVGAEEGREFRFRRDLYSQESTFPLVLHCYKVFSVSPPPQKNKGAFIGIETCLRLLPEIGMAAGVEPEYNALTVTPPGHTSDSLRPSSTVKYLMACYTCACDMRLAYRIKQVCVDSPPSALNMTLPASAAERRHLQHGARSVPVAVDRCFLLAGRSAATPPAAVPAGDRWYRQTDRRTDTRPLHSPCCAYYAGSVNK